MSATKKAAKGKVKKRDPIGNMGGKGTPPVVGVEDRELASLLATMREEVRTHPVSKRGRPTKLTPDLIARIAFFVRRGNDITVSARALGVARSTFYFWLDCANAERPKKIYVLFLDAIEQAMAEAEVLDVSKVSAAASRSWQAAAWKLERRWPKRWGARVVDPSITSSGGGGSTTPATAATPSTGGTGGMGGLRVYLPAKDVRPLDEELPAEERRHGQDDDRR